MKAAAVYVAIFAIVLLLIPMIALHIETPSATQMQIPVHQPAIVQTENLPASTDEQDSVPAAQTVVPETPREEEGEKASVPTQAMIAAVKEFRILDQSSGVVRTVSVRDFVRGAVAAEMPASFHPEALKAQAVAAHTLALHHHFTQQKTPDPTLRGADFAADPTNLKVYVTEDIMQSFYGDKAEYYWGKICEAADSVVSYILEYEQEPIVAAYHAISSGRTEDASNVWVGSAPYLTAVESEGDILAPGYETTATFTVWQMHELLTTAFPDIELPEAPEEWFGLPKRSESGYVVSIRVGNQELHGKDVRTALDLRSHNFEVIATEAGFTFTVCGYGHGVGLSQQGADYLARQGESFDSILDTYYPGAQLKQISFTK